MISLPNSPEHLPFVVETEENSYWFFLHRFKSHEEALSYAQMMQKHKPNTVFRVIYVCNLSSRPEGYSIT